MPAATPREAALLILCKTEYEGAYPNLELKKLPQTMSARDRALAVSLVYGVISKKLTLDYIIRTLSKIKIKKLSKYIHQILRLGIYQLMFTDKIPQSAAVNESVKLAKRYGHAASAGYVNGVLRAAARTVIEYPGEPVKRLSVMYSYPEWLCRRWITEFGADFAEELMKAFDKEPELTLRPNSLKTTAVELAAMLNDEGKNAAVSGNAVVCTGLDVGNDRLYREGFYTVQDKAAAAAAATLSPKPGETVIDMCAAPGGKTTHMAELMKNSGKITAFDIHEHKIKLIEENAARLGITIIAAKKADAAVYDGALKETADKVLCDVPCSGLGILRRKPDIKWNRSPEDDFRTVQLNILKNGAAYLKHGGELVYSTCTIERAENEEITGEFLKTDGFEKLFEKTYYPNTDNTDGFYICKLKKI